MNQTSEPSAWIVGIINDFIDNSPENTLKNKDNDRAFETPLVGFSSGDDPLYEAYKDHVGPFYMTPWEVVTVTFRDFTVKPGDLTVISWILPQSAATKADNRRETFYPSERWARARIFGEEVNVKLRKHVVASLTSKGVQGIAPLLTPQFSIRISPKYGLASTWSERHAAYAAGLGTFGLCDGLITPVGKAMRTGSVVARIQAPPTPRPYTDHHAYCLFFTAGTCKKCIPRCPVRAITEKGKDKRICSRHLFPVTKDYVVSEYGFDGYGCGLCQTGVQCESRIPSKQEAGTDHG
ncbi:MAG: epoxyqueuosine reductase [Pseudomonadota bacterium]